MQSLRWGIIATGFIAEKFAEGLRLSRSGKLVAVSSRDLAKARAFAEQHGAARAHGSTAELLGDADVDAVYISSPHPFHMEMAIAAAQAGKHALCEKPIGMNAREAEAIFAAARANRVRIMEAYMYRCHPQTARIAEALTSGAIGRPRHVQASFGFNAPFAPTGRLFDKRLGGGAILDVGGYPLSLATLVARIADGSRDGATQLQAMGTLHPQSGADTLALANIQFACGLSAQVAVSTQTALDNQARIFGETGWIEAPEPWIVAREGGEWSFRLHRAGANAPEVVSGRDARGLYGIEADHFAALIRGEPTEAPGMSETESLQLNQLLDRWRFAVGARFERDEQ